LVPGKLHQKKKIKIIGIEYIDALARKPITTYSDVANTPINTAGSKKNPFYNIYWLANEYDEHRIMNHIKPPEHSPVTYLRALVPIQFP
jgi:hypothetical protein